MREPGGLIQEQVLHDHALHRLHRLADVMGVGIGLHEVLALHVHALEAAIEGGLEHVGDAQSGLRLQRDTPCLLEQRADRGVGHVAIGTELVWERAHVARALDVVLPPQRIDANALATDVAGRHGQVGDPNDGRRTLAVLGHAEPVVDGAVSGGRIQPCGLTDELRRNARDRLRLLGRVALLRDEFLPAGERFGLAPGRYVVFLRQTFGHDDVCERIEHRDVRARR